MNDHQETNESEHFTALKLDLMYYHVARKSLTIAQETWPSVEVAILALKKLHNEWDQEAAKDDPIAAKMERIAIDTEHQYENVGFKYAPVLEHLAIVQLMCVNCLEATINLFGKARLDGSMFAEFDHLPVTGKWLFLPKVFKLKGFDAGREPFQSFAQMVKWRNLLTHYRQKREPWDGYELPTFMEKLGLSIDHGKRSLSATRQLVQEVHDQFQESLDSGWDVEAWMYFGLVIEARK